MKENYKVKLWLRTLNTSGKRIACTGIRRKPIFYLLREYFSEMRVDC